MGPGLSCTWPKSQLAQVTCDRTPSARGTLDLNQFGSGQRVELGQLEFNYQRHGPRLLPNQKGKGKGVGERGGFPLRWLVRQILEGGVVERVAEGGLVRENEEKEGERQAEVFDGKS